MPIDRQYGVAQHAEEIPEAHALLPGHSAGEELAIQVPDREAVGRRIQLVGKDRLLPVERVEVGDAVPAAVGADQRGHLHLLVQQSFLAVEGADIASPLDLFVGHAEGAEHVVVVRMLAEQTSVHGLQEQAGLRALDDPMVVGGSERDDLGHGQLSDGP